MVCSWSKERQRADGDIALDRIKSIQVMPMIKYIDNGEFDANEYYKDVIGVTVNEGNSPQTVHLAIYRSNTP